MRLDAQQIEIIPGHEVSPGERVVPSAGLERSRLRATRRSCLSRFIWVMVRLLAWECSGSFSTNLQRATVSADETCGPGWTPSAIFDNGSERGSGRLTPRKPASRLERRRCRGRGAVESPPPCRATAPTKSPTLKCHAVAKQRRFGPFRRRSQGVELRPRSTAPEAIARAENGVTPASVWSHRPNPREHPPAVRLLADYLRERPVTALVWPSHSRP